MVIFKAKSLGMLISRHFSRPVYLLTIILLFGNFLATINLLHLRVALDEIRKQV